MCVGLKTTSNRIYGRWVQGQNWVRHVLGLSRIVVGHRSDRLSRMFPLHLMLAALVRWIAGEQQEVIEYLRAENLSVANFQLLCKHP
jgi:hypothetical protein